MKQVLKLDITKLNEIFTDLYRKIRAVETLARPLKVMTISGSSETYYFDTFALAGEVILVDPCERFEPTERGVRIFKRAKVLQKTTKGWLSLSGDLPSKLVTRAGEVIALDATKLPYYQIQTSAEGDILVCYAIAEDFTLIIKE